MSVLNFCGMTAEQAVEIGRIASREGVTRVQVAEYLGSPLREVQLQGADGDAYCLLNADGTEADWDSLRGVLESNCRAEVKFVDYIEERRLPA
jgi:hypothetical protein